jgi:PAS domain S-box-containing protein
METVLINCREWLWAVGPDGRFTFSGPSSRELLGYEPSELLGQHWSVVAAFDALATVRQAGRDPTEPDAAWTGKATLSHRDGTAVQVEICVRGRRDAAGRSLGTREAAVSWTAEQSRALPLKKSGRECRLSSPAGRSQGRSNRSAGWTPGRHRR